LLSHIQLVPLRLGLLLLLLPSSSAQAGVATETQQTQTQQASPTWTPPPPAKKAAPKEDFKYYSFLFMMCLDRCNSDGCATVQAPHTGVESSTGGCVPACAHGGPKAGLCTAVYSYCIQPTLGSLQVSGFGFKLSTLAAEI
jgi:hypothetical protein